MSKSFDTEEYVSQDKTFTVRGMVFQWDDAQPEILSAFSDSVKVNANGEVQGDDSTWELMDRQILLFIVPEDREKWVELRKREREPVTIKQIVEIVRWLWEQQSPVPTEQPSPSEAGAGSTAPTSTAG